MESIIKDNISSYMSNNNLFSLNQHGFTTRRSCTSQLLCAMNYWTQYLDDKYPVDVVYLDFQKAFNSVPHNGVNYTDMVFRVTYYLGLKLFLLEGNRKLF